MMLLRNKRGQEGGVSPFTIGVIVAVLLLVLVIGGFVFNLFGIKDKWNQFAGSSNVDDIKSACNIACQTGRAEDYNASRSITYADGFKTTVTCKQLETGIGACLVNGKPDSTKKEPECLGPALIWNPTFKPKLLEACTAV